MTPSLFWMLFIECLIFPWITIGVFTRNAFHGGIDSEGVLLSCLTCIFFILYVVALRFLVTVRK